jgi:nucleolar protein 16
MQDDNPLNDPLNDLEAPVQQSSKPSTGIIGQLEDQAAQEEAHLAAKRKPRAQSQREEEWMARLVEKHGDDTSAMFRDKKLNNMQQSEGDISRRFKKWKAAHAR